jgi:amidase
MRGLKFVAEKLRHAGHIVVEWQGTLLTREIKQVGDEITLSGMMDDSKCRVFVLISASDLTVLVLHSVESTGEPIYPAISGEYDSNTKSGKSPTPYQIWQLHRKKQQVADRFHAIWQSTADYSGTGRPIDGLIMYVAMSMSCHQLTW